MVLTYSPCNVLVFSLLKKILITFLLAVSFFGIAQSQICFDGSYCPNNDIIGNCTDPDVTDEWDGPNVLDPLTDFGSGGTCDITQIWAVSQNPNIYVAFTAGNQGAANYAIYFNTDCDNTTGDVTVFPNGGSPNGAEFRLQFRVQQGNASNITIAEYVNNSYVTTTTSIAALAGASDGCPAPDGTASNFNFIEIEFSIADIFDPCLVNSCSSIEISYVQTQAGGNPGSADCDAISEVLEFEINQPPTAVITTTTPACAGNVISFDGSMSIDSVPNDDTLFYSWELTDLAGNVLTTTTDSAFDFTFADPGKYLIQLTVEDSFGCQDTSASGMGFDTICIFGAPIAMGIANLSPCSLELTYDAIGSMDFTNLPNLEFLWDFGDGNTSVDSSGIHVYDQCGTYNISLIVSDPDVTFDDCKTDTILFEVFIDTIPPLLTCPSDMEIDCGAALPIPSSLMEFLSLGGDTLDNCGIDPLSFQLIDSTTAMGVCPIIEVITLSFSIADRCGNLDTCTYNVSINDTLPPLITFPAMDSTFDCTASPTDLQAWIDSNGGAMATDLCSDVVWDNNFGMFPGVCAGSNTIEVTFYAADNCGNVDSTAAILTINDNTAPTITQMAMDTIVECDGMGNTIDFVNWTGNQGGAQAIDDCDGVMWRFELINSTPTCANTRVDSVKFLVYDVCGNIDSTIASFTIVDTEVPILSFTVTDTIVACAADIPTAIIGTAEDNCLGSMTAIPEEVVGDSICANDFTVTRTWTFQDSCGNLSEAMQLIIVKDSLPPLPATAPVNVIVGCAADVPVAMDLLATDACNGSVIATPTDVISNNLCANDFTITRTWTFEDSCGNDTSIIQLIVVKDSLAPIPPPVPSDLIIGCAADIPALIDITATDACDGDITVSPTEVVSDSLCVNDFIITRTWTFIDDCGNDTSLMQLIMVKDTLAPVPPAAPADLMLVCAAEVPAPMDITAMDGCNESILSSPIDVVSDSTCLHDFTITRTWSFMDACGNDTSIMQLIIVADTVRPTIVCPADVSVQCGDDVSPAALGFATGSDNCLGTPNVSFMDFTMGGNCPDEMIIRRVWAATDTCGNITNCEQMINIIDGTAPVFNMPPPNDTLVGCANDIPPMITLTAIDNCGSMFMMGAREDTTDMVCDNQFVITRTWVIEDPCGNSDSVKQVIIVQDITAPMFTVPPSDIIVECDGMGNVSDISAWILLNGNGMAADGCGGDITWSNNYNQELIMPCSTDSSLMITFYITDNCGNMDSAFANITVQDTTPPMAICQDIVLDFMNLDTASIIPTDIDLGSMDICSEVSLSLSQSSFNCFDEMDSVEVELTAMDACGNVAVCSANVVFENVLTLDLVCPSDTVIQLPARACDIEVTYVVEARSCGEPPTLVQTDSSGLTSGSVFPIGQTVQSYMAFNEMGDTMRCTFIIEVLENPQSDNLVCAGAINVSLNEFCYAEINAGMLLLGDGIGCIEDFILCGPDSTISPGNIIIIGPEYLGEMINISVKDPETGNVCWTKVTIEDKLDPVLFCKSDTLACDDGLDPLSIGLPLPDTSIAVLNSDGTYSVTNYDLCGPLHLEFYDVNNLFDCSGEFSKIILRFWTATDVFGNQTSCTDTIKVLQSNLDSLILPPNLLGANNPALSCDITCLLPSGAPDPICSGMPTGPICETVVIEYEDVIFNECGGSKKIHRSWTIFDLCSGERIDHEQWIKLADTLAPIINCPDTLMIPANHGCVGSTFVPYPEAVDNCSDFNISQTGASGPFDIQLVAGGVQVSNLSMGINSINFSAVDACGNSSICVQYILVEDFNVPIPVCQQPLTLSLSNGGVAAVSALDLNAGSIDCMPTYYKVIRMDELEAGGSAFANGVSLSDASGLACQGLNGDDLASNNRFEIWFDDETKFCCADVDETEKMVVLRVFDRDPGAGPVNPARMERGGDLYGRYNDCMVGIIVQDKLAPDCIAPNDTIITCAEYLNLNDLSVFGSPSIDDFCGADYTTRETMNVDCGAGLIRRIFTVTDESGSSTRCTQRIRVQNINPFNADSIVWPENHVINSCSMLDLSPEGDGLPLEKRYPRFGTNACNMVHLTYEDEVFNEGLDACFKIFRNWAVVDWCQQDANGFYLRWEHSQVIEVFEQEAPMITGACSDINICIDDDCNLATYLLTNTAIDCAPAESLDWTLDVDLNSDGTIDFTGFENEVPYDFPAGIHTVRWTVNDPCNNQKNCSYTITVMDCKIPSAACQNLIVEAMPPTGLVAVKASTFNYQSTDNCTAENDLRFSYSDDPTDSLLIISCNDLLNMTPGSNGYEFPISMYVHDLAGNFDFCNLILTVQDNQNACNQPMVSVAGNLYTSNDEMIEAASVQLYHDAQMIGFNNTGINGDYQFENLLAANDFIISPILNAYPLNGISTYDIVLLQKHILGIDAITDPYNLIAADVNKSNSISAIDMVELRRLILGITPNFTNNTSWRFMPKSFEFQDPYRPWDFPEVITLDNLDSSIEEMDFIGVKIGDINNSASPNSSRGGRSNNMDRIALQIPNLNIYPGQTIDVPVYLAEELILTGMQFTLKVDPELASIHEINTQQIELAETNLGKANINRGELLFSWNNGEGVKIKKNEPIFFIRVKAVESLNAMDLFQIIGTRLSPELYDFDMNIFALEFQSKPDLDSESEPFELLQNIPNPFNKATIISYVLPEDEKIKLTVFNKMGAEVMHKSLVSNRGLNSTTLDLTNHASGIYYYTIESRFGLLTKKMVLVE